MIQALIYIGLVLVPTIIISGYEPRYPKEIASILVALAIALVGLSNGLKKNHNVWFLFCLGAMMISTLFVPGNRLLIGEIQGNQFIPANIDEAKNLWNYKPIVYAFIYYLMFEAITVAKINRENILKVIMWVGCVNSIYAIIQYSGFDQFLLARTVAQIGTVDAPNVVGFIGQPTHLAIFLCICLPAAIYFRRWFVLSLFLLGILATESAVGVVIAGLIVLLSSFNNKKLFSGMAVGAILISLLAISFLPNHLLSSNGRYPVWINALTMLKNFHHAITGMGAGAFHFMFPVTYKSHFIQAHNEYLEFLFNCGIVGLTFFILSIKKVFFDGFKFIRERNVLFMSLMLLASCLGAMFNFPWQLGATTFYTVVILGLYYNSLGEQYALA